MPFSAGGHRRARGWALASRKSLVRDPSNVVAMLEGKRGHALSAPTVFTSTLRPDLVGRRRERELLEKLLESARAGRSAVLVVHGEPGVGKTALLDYLVQKGDGFRIARTV